MGDDPNDPNYDKTSSEAFDKAAQIKDKEASKDNQITEYDLQKKLDLYETHTTSVEQGMSLARLKQQYQHRKQQKDQDRVTQAIYYKQGKDAGLPHPDYDQVKNNHEIEDNMARKGVLKEAKAVYHSGKTQTKLFEKASKGEEPER